MPFDPVYQEESLTREEVDGSQGWLVLEFGANWCGHCQELSPQVQAILDSLPDVRHVRIADGRGKRLGRSFRVKLWPTLILLRDGQVVAELVRPTPSQLRPGEEITFTNWHW